MNVVRPKKFLGQHFLKDKNIALKIVSKVGNHRKILEVGPGKGILTQYLIKLKKVDLVLIEIDKESVFYLRENFPALEKNIIHGDFLRLNLYKLFEKQFCLVGNFPYNISSQIFFKALDYKDLIVEIVCMIQKEVADRIKSGPGSKNYGILSVLMQTYYDIEHMFNVNEQVFEPPPKVKSSVIRFRRNQRNGLPCNEKLYFMIVKAGFNHRRKMLKNSLESFLLNLPDNNFMLRRRPEQMSIEDFIELTTWIENEQMKSGNILTNYNN